MKTPVQILASAIVLVAIACAGSPDRRTLAELHDVEPDLTEVNVENGLEHAIAGYRDFLEEAPPSSLTPEAMRRLADLKLEQEYGILGEERGALTPAPRPVRIDQKDDRIVPTPSAEVESSEEALVNFEERATRVDESEMGVVASAIELPGATDSESVGPQEAIELYDEILANYPDYPFRDQVLYQKARAFDELGRNDQAIEVIERLVTQYPQSRHIDEVQFRRAEYFFTRRKYFDAEAAYGAIVSRGSTSEYYELALYKLGWTLYKLQFLEEALQQYLALLDFKVSNGYVFQASGAASSDEADERRIADTHRVISLCFSELGGPPVVADFFRTNGSRSFEYRVYAHLAEFYFEKLRYNDAATTYEAFVSLYPLHSRAPHFGMRIVEVYDAGGFPQLVLEAKKDFASRYGLESKYWNRFDVGERPEVLTYIKANLEDLANHYHALYQDPERIGEQQIHFEEARRWYGAFLHSFPGDTETPAIHYQLADLLLENESFSLAAYEYERTAYDYPLHERASKAGYAAIFAHREHQKAVSNAEGNPVRHEVITSTLRFVDTFPDHEHAATVLGAAVDDLYDLLEYEAAITNGRKLIDSYPGADSPIRRAAWIAIAHSSFDLEDYAESESAYRRALELTQSDDEGGEDLVDNLAAAIYQQGQEASRNEDFRSAADHFLRIAEVAPRSDIRPVAEYDAAAALIRLEDWTGAAAVLDEFRKAYPDHELHREATKKVAYVYREAGDFSRAGEEYERVASEAENPELRGEALLIAGELYENAMLPMRELDVYAVYVTDGTGSVEAVVETRFKMAELHSQNYDEAGRREQLRTIVATDRNAGEHRTARTRFLAAGAALVLATDRYHDFSGLGLAQPFDVNLEKKQESMQSALDAFEKLVDYEVGEVTAAATFYIAEIYSDFSLSLMASERPANLSASDLVDYEMVLEEEAFPFEEQAIEVHEKNLELMATGLYNEWVEKSMSRLAVLMPGRYAKFESSTGLISSIETYAYSLPTSS